MAHLYYNIVQVRRNSTQTKLILDPGSRVETCAVMCPRTNYFRVYLLPQNCLRRYFWRHLWPCSLLTHQSSSCLGERWLMTHDRPTWCPKYLTPSSSSAPSGFQFPRPASMESDRTRMLHNAAQRVHCTMQYAPIQICAHHLADLDIKSPCGKM